MAYRTITLKRLYHRIIRVRGLDPDASRYTRAQREQAAELISDRIRLAWEAEMWPELMSVERRQFEATYDAATEYDEDDVVYYTDGTSEAYFISLQDSNTGNTPDFDAATAWWEQVGDDYVTKIDFEQSWETNVIGAADVKRGLFARDPRLYIAERPLDGCRILDGGSILVLDSEVSVARPFVRYRPPSIEVTLEPWNDQVTYSVGDLAYLELTGDCYKALAVTKNESPDVTPASWDLVRIPWMFAEYVKHGVAADFQREDDARRRDEARANEELDRVRDTQLEQRGEVRKAVFRRRT